MTPATMTGTAEVNTAPTRFSPRQPTWSNASSAAPLLSGACTGATSGTLQFKDTTSGLRTVGASNITLEVTLNGTLLENVNLRVGDAPGTKYTLSNGLSVSFGAGTMLINGTFSTTVAATTPTSAGPTKSMNGIGDLSALLDSGVAVSNGSFKVNGTSVSVGGGDDIATVLARVTSTTDVDAAYDAATAKVTLTHTSHGAGPTIALTDDTSGFPAAMTLNGASVTPGTGVDHTAPMSGSSEFSGVSAGNILVNGVSIAIDPATMSLYDVLDVIQASGAGVDAAFNDISEIVSMASVTPEAAMTLDSNGTGFFDASHIAEVTYGRDPTTTTSVPTTTTSRRVPTMETLRRMEAFLRAFNTLQDDNAAGNGLRAMVALRGAMDSAITGKVGSGKSLKGATVT